MKNLDIRYVVPCKWKDVELKKRIIQIAEGKRVPQFYLDSWVNKITLGKLTLVYNEEYTNDHIRLGVYFGTKVLFTIRS